MNHAHSFIRYPFVDGSTAAASAERGGEGERQG